MEEESVRILGVDPGTARLGWAFLEDRLGIVALLDFGCLETASTTQSAPRLQTLFHGLRDLMARYQPQEMAVEKLFFSKNVKTALAVGEARGVILLAAAEAGLRIAEYTPGQVKESVTGTGSAEKGQVQRMVQRLLHLEELPSQDDAADALAIALCHAQVRKMERAVALAEART